VGKGKRLGLQKTATAGEKKPCFTFDGNYLATWEKEGKREG